MKSIATFVLFALLCVPAKAQFGGMGGGPATQARSIEVEILEMEQEADKAALKEALLLQARQGMRQIQGSDQEKRQAAESAAELRDFIAKKKQAIIDRAAEVRKSRIAGSSTAARNARADQRDRTDRKFEDDLQAMHEKSMVDRQTTYERYAEAQINVQLLEAQLGLLQDPLNASVQALAAAELAASNDQAQRAKADTARKEFEKIKEKYVSYSKQLQAERQEMQSMVGMGGMGGMGGGMR